MAGNILEAKMQGPKLFAQFIIKNDQIMFVIGQGICDSQHA